MKFGAMDHLDLSNGLPQARHYEDRLKLVEMFEAAGFYNFCVTEHHFTPLGGASSPSVFLAAASQRTRRLRLGTLVYAVPAHHPIRLLEEICMLDQISNGRLDIGFGRGSVPEELAYLGVDTKEARAIYEEGVAIIEQGLREGSITFEGKHFNYRDVPLHLKPCQQPAPPVWYGVHSTDSALSAARSQFHMVVNEDTKVCAKYIQQFRDELSALGHDPQAPFTGLARTLVVAETDEKAMEIAHRAYLVFQSSFTWMHRRFGRVPQHWGIDLTFEKLIPTGRCIAGSPETVARILEEQHRTTGANFAVLRFSFGDMTFDEMARSVDLFANKVMPALDRVPELA